MILSNTNVRIISKYYEIFRLTVCQSQYINVSRISLALIGCRTTLNFTLSPSAVSAHAVRIAVPFLNQIKDAGGPQPLIFPQATSIKMKQDGAGIKLLTLFGFLMLVSGLSIQAASQEQPKQDWTHSVRIAAYGLDRKNPEEIVRAAMQAHVYGIE